MPPLLSIENLMAGYGEMRILHGPTLATSEGGVTALLGSNGAGKTTLFRTIAGLLPTANGSIFFCGKPIHTLPAHERVEIGITLVPEGRLVFPDLTVGDNLRIGAYSRRARVHLDETMARVLKLFPRLAERHAQSAGTLSGGEQIMLAIGRGMMSRPRLLLLDEPTLGLAPAMAKQIFAAIPTLVAEGISVLMAEQDVQQSLMLADKAFILKNGRIALSGTGTELLKDPSVSKAYFA